MSMKKFFLGLIFLSVASFSFAALEHLPPEISATVDALAKVLCEAEPDSPVCQSDLAPNDRIVLLMAEHITTIDGVTKTKNGVVFPSTTEGLFKELQTSLLAPFCSQNDFEKLEAYRGIGDEFEGLSGTCIVKMTELKDYVNKFISKEDTDL